MLRASASLTFSAPVRAFKLLPLVRSLFKTAPTGASVPFRTAACASPFVVSASAALMLSSLLLRLRVLPLVIGASITPAAVVFSATAMAPPLVEPALAVVLLPVASATSSRSVPAFTSLSRMAANSFVLMALDGAFSSTFQSSSSSVRAVFAAFIATKPV